MEANSTVNLVLFSEDIMELQIRENRNFVVPVDILTLFAHAPFSILFYYCFTVTSTEVLQQHVLQP